MSDKQNLKTMAGIDASRRVGWARFFDSQEDLHHAQQLSLNYLFIAIVLAERIQHHDRLAFNDPLVDASMRLIGVLEEEPWGRRLVERAKAYKGSINVRWEEGPPA